MMSQVSTGHLIPGNVFTSYVFSYYYIYNIYQVTGGPNNGQHSHAKFHTREFQHVFNWQISLQLNLTKLLKFQSFRKGSLETRYRTEINSI